MSSAPENGAAPSQAATIAKYLKDIGINSYATEGAGPVRQTIRASKSITLDLIIGMGLGFPCSVESHDIVSRDLRAAVANQGTQSPFLKSLVSCRLVRRGFFENEVILNPDPSLTLTPISGRASPTHSPTTSLLVSLRSYTPLLGTIAPRSWWSTLARRPGAPCASATT